MRAEHCVCRFFFMPLSHVCSTSCLLRRKGRGDGLLGYSVTGYRARVCMEKLLLGGSAPSCWWPSPARGAEEGVVSLSKPVYACSQMTGSGAQAVETRMTQLSNSLHPSSLYTSLHYLHASFILWYLLSASTAYHRMRVYFKQVRRGIF